MGAERWWRYWAWSSLLIVVPGLGLMSVGFDREIPALTTALQVTVVALAACALVLAAKGARMQRRHRAEVAAARAQTAILRDRLLIASELHDVLSHGLGAITLRARVASRTDSIADAHAALREITELSSEATGELRQLLAVLHDPATPAPLRPAVTIADLADVVAGYRAAGLDVAASGLDTTAPAAVELVAYHVVREALANVARHAGSTHVECGIEVTTTDVRIRVADAGPVTGWHPHPGAGRGLSLLTQRVRAAGGTLAHGPAGTGYRVEATVPIRMPS